jgi:hypothetical protein
MEEIGSRNVSSILRDQLTGQDIDYLSAVRCTGFFQNFVADALANIPIEHDQFRIYHDGGPKGRAGQPGT